LQCRVGQRNGLAAVRIACDMVAEKLINRTGAIARVKPDDLNQLLRPIFDPAEKREAVREGRLLTKGLNAGPGAATGRIVFNADDAETAAARGEPVILVRIETSPEDIHGMQAAEGILTTRGGMTSHAAVVARGMGRPCVAGAGDLRIDYEARTMAARATLVKAGDTITIDGSTGEVMIGDVPTIQPELSGDFATLMGWADAI